MLDSRSFGMSHTSACVQVLPLTSRVTQDKTPTLSEPSFLIYQIWVVIVPTS